jgi:hypothetical protein
MVGLSGRTEFPHLHFTVRRDGRALDPFSPAGPPGGCSESGAAKTAWEAADAAAMVYVNGAIYNIGIAPEAPTIESIRSGRYGDVHIKPLDSNTPVLAPFVEIFGLLAGDAVRLTLMGPTGEVLAVREAMMSVPQARWSGFVGRNRPAAGWQSGPYLVRASVSRAGEFAIAAGRELIFEMR